MSFVSDKTYFKITAMSEAFRAWDTKATYETEGEIRAFEMTAKKWELRFLAAIAQQLSIIAGNIKRHEDHAGKDENE